MSRGGSIRRLLINALSAYQGRFIPKGELSSLAIYVEREILRAVLKASQWADKLENRPRLAEVVSQPQYINTSKEVIRGRLLGEYDYGDGRKERDKHSMTFFDRQTNFPLKSHGVWWLSQFRRWGMLQEPPDYKKVVDRVHRPDLFREVAREMGGGDAEGRHEEGDALRRGDLRSRRPGELRAELSHPLHGLGGGHMRRVVVSRVVLPCLGIGTLVLVWALVSQTVAPDLPSSTKTWHQSRRYVLEQLPRPSAADIAACVRDPGCHRTFVVAHRAKRFGAPENSRAAVGRAVAAGVPIVEISVRASSDGEMFVLHDRDLRRETTLQEEDR